MLLRTSSRLSTRASGAAHGRAIRQPTCAAGAVDALRQLAAAAERHREVLASMQEPGRPEVGQHVERLDGEWRAWRQTLGRRQP
jgi:hypothetical protein